MSVLKGRRKVPKMSTADVEKVLQELDAWCRRERPGRLTWERLEEFAGFTRQALSANESIAQRYGEAKHGNSPARKVVTATPKSVNQRVLDLQRKVDELQAVINRYDVRWSNYAVNATLLGYDLERLEEAVMPPARAVVRVARRPRSEPR
jgi:hypothetical protein